MTTQWARNPSANDGRLIDKRLILTAMVAFACLGGCGGSSSTTPAPVPPTPVVVAPPPAPVQSESCNGGVAVPFTTFGSEGSPLTLTADKNACLVAGAKALNFARDIPVFESVLADDNRVYYAREPFTSFLSAYTFDGETMSQISLPTDQREALHVEHAFALAGQHVFIAYNVETSIPLGRTFDQLAEGLSVWTVKPAQAGVAAALELVSTIQLDGGIEANVHSVDYKDGRAMCINTNCVWLRADAGGNITAEPLPIALDTTGFSPVLVEMASDGETAFALIKREFDDRLQTRTTPNDAVFNLCPVGTNGPCTRWAQNGTPYELSVNAGQATLKSATTASEGAAMMRYDLERLRQTGVGTLGENNVEGRIAWSNVYYLNGLITLGSNEAGLSGAFDKLGQDAVDRLTVELDLIAEQFGQDVPGMSAKRYSLNREYTTSLLLVGRIARAFMRAEEKGLYQISVNKDAMLAEIQPADNMIEVIQTDMTSGRTEFRVRRGAPVWSDGSNTPWNFQNGWIDAMAHFNRLRPDLVDPFKADMAAMMNLFIADENLATLPNGWNYSGGDFFTGWTEADDISTNTPNYSGDMNNTTTAHISYRAMDSIALLEADREGFITLSPEMRTHIGTLVDQGWVYPFVMEALVGNGHAIALPDHLAQSYRRITYGYELQSAPWVMTP